MSINLDPNELSRFGWKYAAAFSREGVADALQSGHNPLNHAGLRDIDYREFYLEFFRRHLPSLRGIPAVSRLSSFFAVDNIEDARRFILNKPGYPRPPRIYTVYAIGEHSAYDMTWLDFKFPRNPEKFKYYYEKYWQGKLIDNDPFIAAGHRGSLREYLITSNVTIGSSVGE
ncbi:hypothetical protein ACN22W_09450 [Burkholderia theae]|uniref:hypothetical protein n=1 Tax=Burkholderia theae TaxID=3143496 RepID=UPI003AFB8121